MKVWIVTLLLLCAYVADASQKVHHKLQKLHKGKPKFYKVVPQSTNVDGSPDDGSDEYYDPVAAALAAAPKNVITRFMNQYEEEGVTVISIESGTANKIVDGISGYMFKTSYDDSLTKWKNADEVIWDFELYGCTEHHCKAQIKGISVASVLQYQSNIFLNPTNPPKLVQHKVLVKTSIASSSRVPNTEDQIVISFFPGKWHGSFVGENCVLFCNSGAVQKKFKVSDVSAFHAYGVINMNLQDFNDGQCHDIDMNIEKAPDRSIYKY